MRRAVGALLVISVGILMGFYLNFARERGISLVSPEFKSNKWVENEN